MNNTQLSNASISSLLQVPFPSVPMAEKELSLEKSFESTNYSLDE